MQGRHKNAGIWSAGHSWDGFQTHSRSFKGIEAILSMSLIVISRTSSHITHALSQVDLIMSLIHYTSSTAQGGGGSFKNRKPIGEIGCCESRMSERLHWWPKGAWGLSLSFSDYLPTTPRCPPVSGTYWLTYFTVFITYLLTYWFTYLRAKESPGTRPSRLVFGGGRGGGPGSGGAQRVLVPGLAGARGAAAAWP